ncbi:uncharacterized protein LOC141549083 [Sminthopsis crassicaudata]|uniref:uncharacterized protein LOC141549083 n=1 Tax=Sminthopsis crassicaudata TaxID=9301 RepID=UPI003D68969B
MRVGSPPSPGRGGSQRQLRLPPGGQDAVSQLPAASSLLPGTTGMERPGRQAVCPAPGPRLTQPAPDWAAPSAAGTRAAGPPAPHRSGPVASPPGDRLVTKDGRLQAFAHPRLLPPPGTTLSFSRALWIWAKGQVLASLRPSQGQSGASAASSHVDGTAGEAPSAAFRGLCCLPPSPSHTHQALHRELLLTHRKGLSLRSRPELLRVLEKRQGPGPEPTPLQEALHRRQQKQQKQQEETKNEGQDEQLEFVRVRERLRHRPPPQPPRP